MKNQLWRLKVLASSQILVNSKKLGVAVKKKEVKCVHMRTPERVENLKIVKKCVFFPKPSEKLISKQDRPAEVFSVTWNRDRSA